MFQRCFLLLSHLELFYSSHKEQKEGGQPGHRGKQTPLNKEGEVCTVLSVGNL